MPKRSSSTSLSLFGDASRAFFATNRANALSVLSSGLIRPRAAYEKYYDDLLMHCGGLVPVWRECVPRSVLPLVVGGEQGMFPVLFEINMKRLGPGNATKIMPDSEVEDSVGGRSEGAALCELIGVPIPFGAIRALCFATESDLDEFRSRDFENLLTPPRMIVDPSAFMEGGPAPEKLVSLFGAAAAAPGTAADFRRLDCAMGAMALLALLAPPSKPWLDALAAAAAFPRVPASQAAPEMNWLCSLTGLVLNPALPRGDDAGVDTRLAMAAIDLLRSASPADGWVEPAIVEAIASGASKGASAEEARDIASWRDVVLSVVRSERQCGPLDDSGSILRRALMLLVLRCRPERIIAARESPMHAGPGVVAAAGVLSGTFHGYSRLPRVLKEKACPADMLADLGVCWWTSVDDIPRHAAIATVTRRDDPTSARITVTVDRRAFVERILRPDEAMMQLFDRVKEAGVALEYDPAASAFVHEVADAAERKRQVLIELGRPAEDVGRVIRLKTICHAPGGRPIRLTKREDATALLGLNHDPGMLCRFALEPSTAFVEVIAELLLEGVDSPNLRGYLDAVVRAASDYEQSHVKRAAARSPKKARPRASLSE